MGIVTTAMPKMAPDSQPAIRVVIANAKGHSNPISMNAPANWTASKLIVARQSDVSKAASEAMETRMTANNLKDSKITG